MNATSIDSLRKNLDQTLQRVCDDHLPVIITREDAEPVVMISLEDFQAMEETAYLLGNSANAARLREDMEQANAGEAIERDLLE